MNRTIVVKLGGSVGSDDTLPVDVAQLRGLGARVVLVHGGGPLITEWLARLGKETHFVDGLRYTDGETLDIVRMVLAGLVNGDVVARLATAGARAVGLSGSDDRMLLAQIRDARYGLVGEVEAVNPAPIQCALGAGYVAVVAPLAVTSDGTFLNVNADTAAAEIAVALGADTFISLTDVDGVSAGDGKGPMRRMSPTMARELIGAGVIHGGMIPKVEACARALAVARAAYIVDGRAPHVVIDALRAADGVGTVVSTDSRE